MKSTLLTGLAVATAAAAALVLSGCGPVDEPAATSGNSAASAEAESSPAVAAADRLAATDPCGIGLHTSAYYKSTTCYPVAVAPVGAEGAPAVVGIVETLGKPILTVTTGGGGPAYDTRIDFSAEGITSFSAAQMAANTAIYDLDGRPGAEIVVQVAERSPQLAYYQVFRVRNGQLQQVTSPVSGSAVLTYGTGVWYFVGELNLSRVLCRDGGISFGQLPSPYTDPVELVDLVSKPGTERGEASEWVVSGRRTVAPSVLGSTDSASRQEHFQCDDLRSKELATGTPVTTVAPAPDKTSTTPSSTTSSATAAACRKVNGDAVVGAAIADLPRINDWQWQASASTSGFDPCRTLSFATTTVDMATNSSPVAIMLFHEGEFVGTASECSPPIREVSNAGDDSVVVTYRYPEPGDSNAGMTGTATRTYRWADGKIVKSGDVPARLAQLAGCTL